MERVLFKCSEIKILEEKIKNNEKNALDIFWQDVKEKGTPLIEPFEGCNEYDLVTIVYKEDKKLDNVTLIPPVGMRNLKDCIMDKVDYTNIWYISYKVKNDISFTYQFSENDTLDKDWNRRWKNVKGDIFNKRGILHYDKSVHKERIVPYVNLENSRKKKYIYENPYIKYGIIIEKVIYSNILKEERKIHIYLPYGYKNQISPYNLITLNDGKEYMNILNAKNILDNLIYSHEIKPSVAVFIESTDNRKEDLSCSDFFTKFIAEELFAFLKQNYNISSDPSKNIIGGYSLGGLAASYIALKYSNVFGNVLSQSGSYWYTTEEKTKDDDLWIVKMFRQSGKLPIKFYINVGVIEPRVSMINTNLSFKDFLIRSCYDVKFNMFGSGHDYLYWDETLADGLMYLSK